MKIVSRLAICLAFGLSFVPSASWAAQGSGAEWGARDPTPCVSITQDEKPTDEQVATLVRCYEEVIVGGTLTLIENVQVAVGDGVPYVAVYDKYIMQDADTSAEAYPIRGSFTRSSCKTRQDAAIYGNPDLNCEETDIASAEGICWRTTFSEWRCWMAGPIGDVRKDTAPPR